MKQQPSLATRPACGFTDLQWEPTLNHWYCAKCRGVLHHQFEDECRATLLPAQVAMLDARKKAATSC